MNFWECILTIGAMVTVPLGFLYLYEKFYDYNEDIAELLDKEKEREEKGCD